MLSRATFLNKGMDLLSIRLSSTRATLTRTAKLAPPAAQMSSICEISEVNGHRTGIVRNEHPLLTRGELQDCGILHTPRSSRLRRQEVYSGLPAQDSGDDCLIQIGVRQKPDLHDGLEVWLSALARINRSRRLAGRGSEACLPSTHFCPWLTK